MSTPLPRLALLLALLVAFATGPTARAQNATACRRCGWTPPLTRDTVGVRNVSQLYDAVSHARPDTTILLDDGEYRLTRMLDIAKPHTVIRTRSGDPSRTIVRGDGMTEQRVGVALSISASDVTLADFTIGYVGFHGVQVRGERAASRVVLHNLHVIDTGQQLVKGSTSGGPLYADDGLLACSTLEYSDHAPSDYTNGIDVLGGKGWTVRDTTFRRIRGPNQSAGPAMLFWANSQLTRVEGNIVIDSFRGIALGLGPPTGPYVREAERSYDHQGGAIENNVIVNLNSWADEGIEANAARDVTIDHNTVLMEGRVPWSISMRFAQTDGEARNNLTSKAIVFRDGGHGHLQANVIGARRDWFVNAPGADLRLSRAGLPPIDAGVVITGINRDAESRARPSGRAPDAGAYEFQQPVP